MRRILTTASLLGILSLASVPAKADVAWLGIGSRFHVGDVHFSLVFGHPGHSYPRGLYYRTGQQFHAHGARCASTCFRSGASYYHSQSCPLIQAHFHGLGIDPYDIYARYAPRGYYDSYYDGGGYGYGYGSRFDISYNGYSRYNSRYNNHYRYDRPGHYQSHGRGGHFDSNGRETRGRFVPRHDSRNDWRGDNRGHGSYDGRGRGSNDGRGHGSYDGRGRGGNDGRGRSTSRNDRNDRRDRGNNGNNGRNRHDSGRHPRR
jgi:hypothetical protein